MGSFRSSTENFTFIGGAFVGRECTTIIKRHRELTAAFGHSEFADPVLKFNIMFTLLDGIFTIACQKRKLTEAEIGILTTKCRQFGVEFPKRFAEHNLTPKVNPMRIVDLVNFLKVATHFTPDILEQAK